MRGVYCALVVADVLLYIFLKYAYESVYCKIYINLNIMDEELTRGMADLIA